MMLTSLGWFLGPLEVPKIDQKSILGPKRGARKRFFIDFSREQRFSYFWAWFVIDFWWFFDQKIDAFFQSRAQFFQHGDGLNLCTGAVFSALVAFFVFLKIVKTWPKKHNKTGISEKHRKMMPRWSPDGPKMAQNSPENRWQYWKWFQTLNF